MQLFYSDSIIDKIHFLPEAESKHLIRVLRKKLGDQIMITDGKGSLFESKIIDDNPKKCGLEIFKKDHHRNPLKREIHIAIAPTKNNDRLEWFVEKAVEIGVTSITPIICDHSERVKLKLERIEKVCVSAMKQSNRLYLPEINPVQSFTDFINSSDYEHKLIAHCEDTQKTELDSMTFSGSVCLLIGPEGDFSPSEIESALDWSFLPTSIGDARLRTETAGVAAVTLLNFI